MEMKIAVIGGGVSGLSVAQMLQKKNQEVVVFESEGRPGGMIKCDLVDGNLFHRTGGHVFNTKRKDVMEWFWTFFNREKEFVLAQRNSVVSMQNGKLIPYPIENHVYMLEPDEVRRVIQDLLEIEKCDDASAENFADFLRLQFGQTLYKMYFEPYNYKVWRCDLSKVPLSWLAGKLPMPSVSEIFYNNIHKVKEKEFVHSSFYYPLKGGSQFIADRLSEGLSIHYNTHIESIVKVGEKYQIDGDEFDLVIFCGNIKQLPTLLKGNCSIENYGRFIEKLDSHGTTSVFCEIDRSDYSWVYLPSKDYESHRIICTGNFSKSNNACGKMTGTIEFTDEISIEEIKENLQRMPFSPKYLTHHYAPYTYPIQDDKTREMIGSLKNELKKDNIYLLGRFAEWEYYNMDVAMGAALDLVKELRF